MAHRLAGVADHCGSLDRGNAGNAKLQGLLDILGDNADHKFSILLSMFYVTYIVSTHQPWGASHRGTRTHPAPLPITHSPQTFNIPGNILGSIIPPNYALALGALIWGVASSAQAGANNFAGIVVCRLFIGLGEAGFGAAVPLYYGLWYRREEIAVRISLYCGAGSLAGA